MVSFVVDKAIKFFAHGEPESMAALVASTSSPGMPALPPPPPSPGRRGLLQKLFGS
jgi:hypothetical protein